MSTPLVIEIGGTAVALACPDARFRRVLRNRYRGFLSGTPAAVQLDIEATPAGTTVDGVSPDADAEASFAAGEWHFQRGDFRADWNPATGKGTVRLAASRYALDSVLRILHTLLLAPRGGLLLHAASAVSDGRGYVFAGVSGAGKSTLVGVAPARVTPLTDEVSYVTPDGEGYRVWGTPFAGDWGKPGPNISAPLAAIYLIRQGAAGAPPRREPLGAAQATAELMRSTLFFARERESIAQVFGAVGRLQARATVERLYFPKSPAAWEAVA